MWEEVWRFWETLQRLAACPYSSYFLRSALSQRQVSPGRLWEQQSHWHVRFGGQQHSMIHKILSPFFHPTLSKPRLLLLQHCPADSSGYLLLNIVACCRSCGALCSLELLSPGVGYWPLCSCPAACCLLWISIPKGKSWVVLCTFQNSGENCHSPYQTVVLMLAAGNDWYMH